MNQMDNRYSLVEKGQPLAARCSEFDYAVQNLTQAASVPTIPVMAARFVLYGNNDKFGCSVLFFYEYSIADC